MTTLSANRRKKTFEGLLDHVTHHTEMSSTSTVEDFKIGPIITKRKQTTDNEESISAAENPEPLPEHSVVSVFLDDPVDAKRKRTADNEDAEKPDLLGVYVVTKNHRTEGTQLVGLFTDRNEAMRAADKASSIPIKGGRSLCVPTNVFFDTLDTKKIKKIKTEE